MTSEWAPPGSEPVDESQASMLAEMSALRERIAGLGAQEFAERYALEKRLDEIRARLHDATADDLAAANEEWAERAGRKGEHAEDPEAMKARARIITPSAGGTG